MVKCYTMILENLSAKTAQRLKQTQSSTLTRQFTQGNDILGDVTVNFADNFIISQQTSGFLGNTSTFRQYSSGWYSITVETPRVQ